jgi:NADH-quinone oxidoreductase subunit H
MQGRPGPNRAIVPWFAWVPSSARFCSGSACSTSWPTAARCSSRRTRCPGHVNKFYFILAPIVAMMPALTTVTVVPFGAYLDEAGQLVPLMLANVDVGILAVFAVSSLGVYSLILAGWASNSKYPFLGSVRASAQLISYELSMTLSVLPVFLWINAPGREGTLSLVRVVEFQSQPGRLSGAARGSSSHAGVGADLPRGAVSPRPTACRSTWPSREADLVGGFHTEYGAFKWSLFFVAEYSHMLVGSGVFVLLFLGGWNPLPWVPLACSRLAPSRQRSGPLVVGAALRSSSSSRRCCS